MTPGPVRENPYPGLRPFTTAEAHLFFGRDTLVDEMLLRLERSRFLALVGTSGSGKSSLLQAGLLPRLQGDLSPDAERWRVMAMRPWTDPLGRLARGLAQPGLLSLANSDSATPVVIEAALRRSGLGLLKLATQTLPGQTRLLIVIDQFEELFRFRGSTLASTFGDDSAALVALLLETVRSKGQVSVLISMRSDFIGECARFPGLPELVSASQYLVPRLTRDQFSAAITEPAAIERAAIAPALVQQLLNDVEDVPDQLPILQHALMRTWQRWAESPEDRQIDFADYKAIGGMTEALSRHVDQAFGDLTDDQRKRVARRIFVALTDQPPHAQPVRRPLRFDRLVQEVGAGAGLVSSVIEHFRGGDRHFLVTSDDVLKPTSIVDISHESLLRLWGRLKGWLQDESESKRQYSELVAAAARHEAGDLSPWGERELAVAHRWIAGAAPDANWASRYGIQSDFDAAMGFIAKSERLASRRSRLRVTLWTLTVVTAAVVVFLVLRVMSNSQSMRLQESENKRLAALVEKTQGALSQTLESQRRTANELGESADRLQKSAESLETSKKGATFHDVYPNALDAVRTAESAIERALKSMDTSAEIYHDQQRDLQNVQQQTRPTVQTSAKTPPSPPSYSLPQNALRGYKVGIYFLKDNASAQARAKDIETAIRGLDGVMVQQYPIDRAFMGRILTPESDEIRYDASSGDEKRASEALQQALQQGGAGTFKLRMVGTPTPGFISVMLQTGMEGLKPAS